MSKAVILGAGSIGCFVGISWITAGLDVSFIGRSPLAEAFEKSGGKITDGDFCVTVATDRISFSENPEILAEADIIALSVKTVADEDAAAAIRRYARPDAVILSLQNGVDNALHLSKMLPGFAIVEGMVPFNVIRPKTTSFKKATTGSLMLGRNAALEAFLAPLENTPSAVQFRDDMRAVKWSKLLLNLNNALNALSGLTLHAELSQKTWRLLLAKAQEECFTVMHAEGITPAKLGPLPPTWLPALLSTPDWFFNKTGLKLQKFDKQSRSSMADDFAADRKSEIDFLNGAVVAYAHRHKLACPVNETLVRLVKQAEAGGRKVWTAEDIAAECARLA